MNGHDEQRSYGLRQRFATTLRLPPWLREKPPALLDWLLFAVLAGACYLVFQHPDLRQTGGASLLYLQGHLLDFYDSNARIWTPLAYLPSTFVVFALWNIPLWVLGVVNAASVQSSQFLLLMWYKMLPTLAYLVSALVIYKIGIQAGFGAQKSRVSAFVWLTTPIAFYSQFIFGQYDSLGLILVLIGLHFYFKKNLSTFALLCGVAFTFKYFALLLFLPLLLLAEKRISALLLRICLFALPTPLIMLPYLPSQAFWNGVFGYFSTSYVWTATISNGYVNIQLFLIAWLFLCAWAYFVDPPSDGSIFQWTFFFANASMFAVFGLAFFHAQWLIWASPFWVISTFMSRKARIFLILDILIMLCFTAFVVTFSPRDVDQQLFALGLLKGTALPVLAAAVPMKDFFIIKDPGVPYSVLSMLMLVNVVFKHPRYLFSDPAEVGLPSSSLIRTRFLLGIAIFILPATASLILALNTRPPFFSTAKGDFRTIGPMVEGRKVSQVFLAKTSTITAIQFLPGRNPGTSKAQLTVQLLDLASHEVMYAGTIDAQNLLDRTYYTLRVPSIRTTIGRRYALVFQATNTQDKDYVTLYCTADSATEASHYASIDGIKQSFDLVVRIFGT
jgi:hypothetical protein